MSVSLAAPIAAPAQEPELPMLATATVSRAAAGDAFALGFLGILLDLPEPGRSTVLAAVENSDLIDTLARLRVERRSGDRALLDSLASRLAVLQGAATRDAAATASPGTISVNLLHEPTQWLVASLPGGEPGELVVETAGCTPDIVAFPVSLPLPARPLQGQVRLSPELVSVSASGPVALRVTAGNCEGSAVALRLSHGGPRTVLRSSRDPALTAPVGARFDPSVEPDRLTVVSLDPRVAARFSVATEPGFVYEVFAAPLTPGVDPALMRTDPDRAGAVADRNDDEQRDDGSWRPRARLTPFIGSGRTERLSVQRLPGARGDVAILVHRSPIPVISLDSSDSIPLTTDTSAWRRISLPAGRWSLTTADLTPGVDSVLIVYDLATAVPLGLNDDVADGDLASQVTLDLEQPTELVIRVKSIEGQGTCTLRAIPSANPASSRRTSPSKTSTDVST
jgi:hypothetical protein